MKTHSSLAGRLGVSGDEIEKLITLDAKDFERREWLALKYAQDWAYLDGVEPSGDFMVAFRGEYGAGERKRILKLMRAMRFANLWNNTVHGRAWREEPEGTCEIGSGK